MKAVQQRKRENRRIIKWLNDEIERYRTDEDDAKGEAEECESILARYKNTGSLSREMRWRWDVYRRDPKSYGQ